MQLTQALHKGRREQPSVEAVVCGGTRLTYAQLIDRVARLAAGLQAMGVKPGDRVGMLGLNSARYVEFLYAVWWAGAVVNPVNIRWSPKEVAYSLDDCDTTVLFVDDAFAPTVAALKDLSTSLRTLVHSGDGPAPHGMASHDALIEQSQPVPDAGAGLTDMAAVMYTGGTTGMPKGVMLSHANLYVNALGSAAAIPRKPGAIGLIVTPMFHVAGTALVVQLLMRSATVVLVPVFDEVAILALMQRERASETFLVPTMIKRIIEHPRFHEFDVSALTTMLYGAAPIDSALLDHAMTAFPRADFSQAYGMTELAPTVAVLKPVEHLAGPHQAKRLRSAGTPVPVAEIRIVAPDGRELPAQQVGEITVRGPMVMVGYWNKPKETEEALRGGWMHTGDSGYLDEHGFLFVVDRIKDMIVSGGENIYSAEVENAIAQMPAVSMSAVIGIPDDTWGEKVHAVVVLRPGLSTTEDAVIDHCRELIAHYKCPRSVEFRSELPVSAAGKLQKFQLREPFWRGRGRRVN